jgi:hypothetical protein
MLLLRLLKLLPLMIMTMCAKVAEGVTCSTTGCTWQSLSCRENSGNFQCHSSYVMVQGPVHITNLKSIYIGLYFHNNEITSFTPNAFQAYSKLNDLSLYDNKLTTLPPTLFGTNAEIINLNIGTNPFTSFSSRLFGNVKKITGTLNMNNMNELVSLSTTLFANDAEVGIIAIESNAKLESFSSTVFANTKTISTLSIQNNPNLLTLPSFASISTLNYVYFQNNKLTTLPPTLFGNNTEIIASLNIGQNPFTSFSSRLFGNVKKIGNTFSMIYMNELVSLSTTLFANDAEVGTISINNNAKLESISSTVFANIKSVSTLNIINNPNLITLPTTLFTSEAEVDTICIDNTHNKLQTVSPTLFNNIKKVATIYLKNNPLLKSLPQELFATHTELTKIDLSNNPLLIMISRFAFQNNIHLQTLTLTNTPVRLSSIQCPEFYHRTKVDILGTTYYACDICERPPNTSPTLTFTCWKGNRTSDFTTHHPPHICPRGSWCDPTTYSETLCPHGMFSMVFRSTS